MRLYIDQIVQTKSRAAKHMRSTVVLVYIYLTLFKKAEKTALVGFFVAKMVTKMDKTYRYNWGGRNSRFQAARTFESTFYCLLT